MLRIAIGFGAVEYLGADKVFGEGVMHNDYFVESLNIATRLKVVALAQDLEQLHHLLAAGLGDPIEEQRVDLGARSVV